MDLSRFFYVVGGLVLAVGSLLFGALPGPGTLTFFLGLGMIAGEFRPVARLLYWGEARVKKLGRWVKGTWIDVFSETPSPLLEILGDYAGI